MFSLLALGLCCCYNGDPVCPGGIDSEMGVPMSNVLDEARRVAIRSMVTDLGVDGFINVVLDATKDMTYPDNVRVLREYLDMMVAS